MTDAARFGVIVAGCAGLGLLALLLDLVSIRMRVPAPALVLASAAVGIQLLSGSDGPDPRLVEQVVSLALVAILLDGGMRIGRARLAPVAGSVLVVGVVGTLLTTAGIAVLAYPLLNLGWYPALLLGAVLAPTDPAVVFAVFAADAGATDGHAVTVLEGESGANDPVGIAVVSALVAAGGISGGALLDAAGHVAGQLALGLLFGALGGYAVLATVRRVGLRAASRYPLLVLLAAFLIFGSASAAHGSGFLAVFVAGIVLGQQPMPFEARTGEFLGALAALGEISAFVLLGLTVDLDTLARADVWLPGLVIGLGTALLVRPLAVGPCLIGAALTGRERTFVLWAGLKGAVPILLGTSLLAARVDQAQRMYGIVVVVVMFSVLVQGSTIAAAARWTRTAPTRPGGCG